MDEQQAVTAENAEDTAAEQPQGAQTDWKAEARKWERYAKENASKAKELDDLKAAQLTEQERLVKRAEEAEAKLAEANAAIQHARDVNDVAAESGVPASLLEFCSDRAAMESFAEQFNAAQAPQPVHAAAAAPASRIAREGGAKRTNADAFADMLADF